ncbi:MAG: radical SAM protein [Victivallaceae bacterium]|nr:radical SAM protein [Victivallaceae bacterium]
MINNIADSQTATGEPRGRIALQSLKELWINTGSLCNLSCPFCFENCSPTSKRLDQVTFDDVQPYIDQAVAIGVERISFTGGEPFINKDFIKILGYVLERKPCMILSNGTEPLLSKIAQIRELKQQPYELVIRLSLDFPDATSHDANRGAGSFAKTMESLKKLSDCGIKTATARIHFADEDMAEVQQQYAELFKQHGLPEDLTVAQFPDLDNAGTDRDTPEISANCIKTYYGSLEQQACFMCSYSRMLLKQHDQMTIFACTLVDDDDFFDFGSDLKQAMATDAVLKHHRCFDCFSCGVACGEL